MEALIGEMRPQAGASPGRSFSELLKQYLPEAVPFPLPASHPYFINGFQKQGGAVRCVCTVRCFQSWSEGPAQAPAQAGPRAIPAEFWEFAERSWQMQYAGELGWMRMYHVDFSGRGPKFSAYKPPNVSSRFFLGDWAR